MTTPVTIGDATLRKFSEHEYVMAVYKKLMLGNYLVSIEVACAGRSIDLVFFRDAFIHSCEFKLSNVAKAKQQGQCHALGADYSWIVMPSPNKNFKHPFLGLMRCDIMGNLFIIKEASRNETYPIYRKLICGQMMRAIPVTIACERINREYAQGKLPL